MDLRLASLTYLFWIICAIHVEDVGASAIRTSKSPFSHFPSTQPQAPAIPTTPRRPKTLTVSSTPRRPKTLAVPSTPKRRQILPTLSTPKRRHSNKSVTSYTTAKPTPTEDSVCEDYHVTCRRWANFGYCYNGYVRNYMRKVCKKSCNFCGHMRGKCRDNHYYCPSWTWRGGCERNAAFMRLFCRHSCNVC